MFVDFLCTISVQFICHARIAIYPNYTRIGAAAVGVDRWPRAAARRMAANLLCIPCSSTVSSGVDTSVRGRYVCCESFFLVIVVVDCGGGGGRALDESAASTRPVPSGPFVCMRSSSASWLLVTSPTRDPVTLAPDEPLLLLLVRPDAVGRSGVGARRRDEKRLDKRPPLLLALLGVIVVDGSAVALATVDDVYAFEEPGVSNFQSGIELLL
jgi:hypothetical protein